MSDIYLKIDILTKALFKLKVLKNRNKCYLQNVFIFELKKKKIFKHVNSTEPENISSKHVFGEKWYMLVPSE